METHRQWLPLGWKVMVVWGVFSMFLSIVVPLVSVFINPALFTYGQEDAMFVGMGWDQVVAMSPGMAFWMVLMMASMCAMMMGYGILTLDIGRKAYRAGERWAWKTLLVSNVLVLFPYYIPIAWLYARKGLYGIPASLGYFPSGVNIGIPLIVVWIIVLYVGLWLPRKEVR